MSVLAGPGPDGTERLYVSYTYISSMDFVAFDPETGDCKVWPNSQGGAWAMETGPDGRIYIGTYTGGHILRFNPRAQRLEDLGQAIPGETYVWRLSLGPDRMLYGCTYPGAKLLQIEPATGKMNDLGRMDPSQNYNRTLCAAPDGWVYCGIGSEKGNLVAYNPETKELRSLLPEEERKPGFGSVIQGEDGNAYGTFAGKNYAFKDGKASVIADLPAAKSQTRLKNGREASASNKYPGRDLPIFRIAAGPDGKIYGSTILPEYLLRFDPGDMSRVTMGLIPGAEAYSMLSAHGKLFIASYTGATLQIYDPTKPFAPGGSRDNNPSHYGSTAPEQDRPYDIALGADGRIYMACVPSYGHHGGAISWYDPKTDQVEYVPSPLEDHAIASICTLPGGPMVVGTSIEGGPGTQPLVKEASLFIWDPERKENLFECVPVAGAGSIDNLTVGGDGLVYGSAGGELFAFDPKTRRVLSRITLRQGRIGRAGLLTLKDGRVVGLAGAAAILPRFSRGRWQVIEFARSDAPFYTGKAVLGDWLYAATEQHLLRCKIPPKP